MGALRFLKRLFHLYLADKVTGIIFRMLNLKDMYSLDCSYYTAEFKTIGDLISHIMISGMDPNYEITFNGKGTSEMAADLLGF